MSPIPHTAAMAQKAAMMYSIRRARQGSSRSGYQVSSWSGGTSSGHGVCPPAPSRLSWVPVKTLGSCSAAVPVCHRPYRYPVFCHRAIPCSRSAGPRAAGRPARR